MLDGVSELHPPRGHVPHPAADPDGIIIPGGLAIADRNVTHCKAEPVDLEIAITHAAPAKVLGASNVQPDQVPGVVHHSHLVGLGVVDPHVSFRDR